MPDLVGPIVMPAHDAHIASKVCPRYSTEFQPKRANQKYCSQACQKAGSAHTARGLRTKEKNTVNYFHYDRAGRLAEIVYAVPPSERLGMMKDLLTTAEHDARLRNILTDPKLHKVPPRGNNRRNIAQAASAYTKKFFGVSIKTYLQQVREGSLKDAETMPPKVDFGPVQMLGRMKKVKCWHKPLSTYPRESTKLIFDQDMRRVAAIVELSERNGSHWFTEQASAAA